MSFSEINVLTSPRNALDPRAKLFALLVISLLAVYYSDLGVLFILLLLIFLTMMIASISLQEVRRILLPLLQMSLPVVILQSFFHLDKGYPIISIDSSQGTIILIGMDSLSAGLSIMLKMLIIASASLIFSLTTNPEELLQGLRSLKVPIEIAYMIGLVLYFLPVIRKELDEVKDALSIKGFSLANGSLKERTNVLTTILISTLLNFSDKIKFQAMSMEARGFRSQKNVTYIYKLDFRVKDSLFTMFSFVTGFLIIIMTQMK
ncbi:MAG: energy-coupling factor transporter transmembrane component T family protein [Candidatus Hodarchaeales archaeon]